MLQTRRWCIEIDVAVVMIVINRETKTRTSFQARVLLPAPPQQKQAPYMDNSVYHEPHQNALCCVKRVYRQMPCLAVDITRKCYKSWSELR